MASQLSIPNFPVPPGGDTVQVSIIDSTTRIGKLPLEFLMTPPMLGMEYMPVLPSWSFLIQHASGEKLLFDLGVPGDWRTFAPVVTEKLEARGWDITVDKEVVDVLGDHGVAAHEISGIIWSHWHWDHLGDPSRFPPSTELIVGPGFKEQFLPGYPAKPDSPVRESDFSGRNLREIDFTTAIQVGQFRAVDYFSDGSFYILDTPGHAIGHLAGLARTTKSPDTFIFMGGDLCHHSGEMRPSKYMPIPSGREHYPTAAVATSHAAAACLPCPGAATLYDQLQVSRNRSCTQTFFDPTMGLDIAEAMRTIEKAQHADARDNIWFIYAHDPSLLGVADLFPLPANAWKDRNWRQKTQWTFLQDFAPALEILRGREEKE
ncbi:beta-lactamase-like protein [Aspergillus pseudoustus]|uniref:Beta-lactamase-like protein n=1 Tax=Aspergillus pseudoustus TaxID=1810923 RepID=A0ABR4IUT1_9EURO